MRKTPKNRSMIRAKSLLLMFLMMNCAVGVGGSLHNAYGQDYVKKKYYKKNLDGEKVEITDNQTLRERRAYLGQYEREDEEQKIDNWQKTKNFFKGVTKITVGLANGAVVGAINLSSNLPVAPFAAMKGSFIGSGRGATKGTEIGHRLVGAGGTAVGAFVGSSLGGLYYGTKGLLKYSAKPAVYGGALGGGGLVRSGLRDLRSLWTGTRSVKKVKAPAAAEPDESQGEETETQEPGASNAGASN